MPTVSPSANFSFLGFASLLKLRFALAALFPAQAQSWMDLPRRQPVDRLPLRS